MLEVLKDLINQIQNEYSIISKIWLSNPFYQKINLKNLCVIDINDESNILNVILAYRSCINDNIIPFSLALQNYNFKNCRINTRVKAQNSIEFKVDNYKKNHENGNVPIIKCFNDLYGIRIILDETINYKQIIKYLNENFSNLKPIYREIALSGSIYKAAHVYFKIDNYYFQWELQIWNKEDEQTNLESHKKYKQDYVKWEAENKGGDHIG